MMQTLETLTGSFGGLILVKSTLLLALAFVVSLLLRKASAATRHYLWTLTFVAILVLPFATRASFFGIWRIPVPILTPVPEPAMASPLPRPAPAPSPEIGAVAPRSSHAPSPALLTISWWQALWIAGSILLLARLSVGLFASYRAKSRAVALMDDSWLELLESAREKMGIHRPVQLALAPSSTMPITLGIWKPTILLPESSDAYPLPRRSAVLLHELAHVRRRDCFTQLMCQAACAVFWWHPLVWIGARQMRTLSERASDDLVLDAGTRASEYAHDLLDMARGLTLRGSAAPLASVTMAHRSRLEQRLLAILDDGMARGPVNSRVAFPAAVASVGILLSVALAMPTAAVSIGPPVVPVAQEDERAQDETPEPEETRQETEASSRARAALAEALDDPDESVREQALHALVQLGDESTIPYLEEALRSGNAEMREEAAWGLGQMRREEASGSLISALSDDSDGVREQAAWALGMTRSESAVAGLSSAVTNDSASNVREQAAWALGMIRSDAATDALVQGLGDEDANVRSQAAWACGMIRTSAAVDGLVATLRDEDEDVRSQAAWALGMIRDSRALDGLAGALGDASEDVREQAIWAVGMLRSSESLDVLIGALRDTSPDIRSQAAWALGMLGDSSAVDALSDALKDEDADVREQAAWAIGQIARDGDDDMDLDMDVEVEIPDLDIDLEDEDADKKPLRPDPRGAIL